MWGSSHFKNYKYKEDTAEINDIVSFPNTGKPIRSMLHVHACDIYHAIIVTA